MNVEPMLDIHVQFAGSGKPGMRVLDDLAMASRSFLVFYIPGRYEP